MGRKAFTTKELIKIFSQYKTNDLRCPYCLNILSESDENKNIYYCSNEMCLNENEYDKEGENKGVAT